MLKHLARLESVIGDKIGHLYLDQDTPLNVVKDMLFEFLMYVGNIDAQIKQQQAAQAAAQASADGAQTAVQAVDETASQPVSQPVEPQAS